MPVQKTERLCLELAEHVEFSRITDFLGAKRGQIFRGQLHVAEVFRRELPTGRPKRNIKVKGQNVVQYLNGGVQHRSFHHKLQGVNGWFGVLPYSQRQETSSVPFREAQFCS